MKHFFENIKGWFDFQDLYKFAVELAPINKVSNFIEIGSFHGKSASFMATEIINSGKPINFFCVDTFISTKDGLSFRKEFEGNLSKVLGSVNILEMKSYDASNLFGYNIFDFIFIDAIHTYDSVLEDLRAWKPKLKCPGIIAGHDYNFPECKRAVDEFFSGLGMAVEVKKGNESESWLVKNFNCNGEII